MFIIVDFVLMILVYWELIKLVDIILGEFIKLICFCKVFLSDVWCSVEFMFFRFVFLFRFRFRIVIDMFGVGILMVFLVNLFFSFGSVFVMVLVVLVLVIIIFRVVL